MYSENNKPQARVTINTLSKMKQAGEKFSCLTAYDASFGHVLDQAGIDVILVGDSLGMVIQGHETTVPVSMDDMSYHAACVANGMSRAMLMVDMPFMSYATVDNALVNAARLMQEGGAHMVKLEGGRSQLPIVEALSKNGIPVCAHIGLQPQSVHKLGGYRVQGREKSAADAMLIEAEELQQAGADIILLECVPASLADEITKNVDVPVIGIGAGAGTDSQVLVLQDILGITAGKTPKFSKNFMQGANSILEAIEHYDAAVKDGSFPSAEHIFS
ncbi:MAG: 3-methyl-2-oxobutanoate hydroxymethyltransferase [Gammaproteobacteria bacterium]|nr:3-methyl-2-oxobutanoate hydroxymethyltransferase [Gammaproteobacteria bacterium]